MMHGPQVATSTEWVIFYTFVGSEYKLTWKVRLANKIVRFIVRVAHFLRAHSFDPTKFRAVEKSHEIRISKVLRIFR
jgi:hypothetical protein